MKKEEKATLIDAITKEINSYPHIYITDISGLNAEDSSDLRRLCYGKNIKLVVVKNTLLKLALGKADNDFEGLYETLKGNSAVMFSEVGNAPAKVIEEFRKKSEKPILKSAFVEESIYIGDDQLKTLSTIKSKEELIGEVIQLLQSPIKNVVASLESGKNILSGLMKALEERN